MWNIKSTRWKQKPICRHLHNCHLIRYALIMYLSIHHWLSWAIGGQNLPEILVQLPAFISLFTVGTMHSLAVHCLTWLWEQLGFPFPRPLWDSLKCLIFCAEVSQLFQMSDAVCGTECWEQSKRNPELKGVWVTNEILLVRKGWWLELYFFF